VVHGAQVTESLVQFPGQLLSRKNPGWQEEVQGLQMMESCVEF
jgi:hypothetical protein